MRNQKYDAMSINELHEALSSLYASAAIGHEDRKNRMMEIDCCNAVIDQKEISLLISMK